MVYTYTPTYYSTIHDSITSLCKNILPFSFKKRRGLPDAEQKLEKLQSDNLKWQQDSFHQILKLMGLKKEGILEETEVSAFRSHMLDTLIASPPEHEQLVILRGKLVFLQDLLHAKCISEEEYHFSKRPILQRLALQGAEVDARDVICGGIKDPVENTDDEWSVIDLRDEKCLIKKESNAKKKFKQNSAIKQIKGAASVFGFSSGKNRGEKSIFETIDSNATSTSNENPFWDTKSSILKPEKSLNGSESTDTAKRKPFSTLFERDQKKQWGFDGLKKWTKNYTEDETSPLSLNNVRSDCQENYTDSNKHFIGMGPDTKKMKKNLLSGGSSSDFFIDKVVGDNIKQELSRIQAELNSRNPNLKFSDDQIESISTKLPVDKDELKKFFPKSWCDRYGDVVLDVVKKEFKEHVGEMEERRKEKHVNGSTKWITFDDENENLHPNLSGAKDDYFRGRKQQSSNPFEQNPFANTTGGPFY